MYNNYFGFKEKPFKLVPNPEYLFLSKTHEIALAHLTFAAEQGDGFVVIIGEVGTGKTTLCRNYLESLDDQTDSAYIFNPHLDANELLAGICHEYGMRTAEKGTKALLDRLNLFLIKQNSAGRRVVLLIDEAQMLSTDNLEMVRMLSNLETTRNKLLQIILVGQPELAEKLETYELRQLAQRISLNFHLAPLSAQDTEAYIQHRIGVASKRYSQLFTRNACKLAFQYAKGIPRLINIVCDRALLVAFTHDKPKINKSIMQAAISELISTKPQKSQTKPKSNKLAWTTGTCAVFIVLAAAMYYLWNSHLGEVFSTGRSAGVAQEQPAGTVTKNTAHKVPKNNLPVLPSETNAPAETDAPAVEGSPMETETISSESSPPTESVNTPPDETAVVNIDELFSGLDPFASRKNCTIKLLAQWHQTQVNIDLIPNAVDNSSYFDIAARQYGLRNYEVRGDWRLVKEIGLPAILTLTPPGRDYRVYMNLMGHSGENLRVAHGHDGKVYEVNAKAIRPYIAGAIHIFWKNIIGFDMIIGHGSDDRAVLMVKNLLRKIGYDHIKLSPEFDFETRLAIRDFQQLHQLKVDGLVGPLTKIMLLRQAGTAGMPQLNSEMRTGS